MPERYIQKHLQKKKKKKKIQDLPIFGPYIYLSVDFMPWHSRKYYVCVFVCLFVCLCVLFVHYSPNLGYPAMSGPAPIRIWEIHTASSVGFIHVIMYLLIAIVFVTNYHSNKMDIQN